jgi:mannose-1-phosphate guanylyltransferase
MAARLKFRALVLAAGLGTRLRPLTGQLPKPLLPVLGKAVAQRTLEALAAAGCEAAVLNTHHLGEAVQQQLGERCGDMPLTYSHEKEIQGTLGALAPLEDFFADAEAIVLVNGDSLCRWPLARLLRRHRGSGARATLLLSRRADPERFGGGVGIDRDRAVVSLTASGVSAGEAVRHCVFAGAHVLSPELLDFVDARPADIVRDLYEPLLAAGAPLQSLLTRRRWHDLGTPERYLEALLAAAQGPWPWGRSWVSPEARVASGARLRQAVVEAGARVEAGAQVEGSAVLPGARVGRGARLVGSLLGPGAELPSASVTEHRMVSKAVRGFRPGPRDTVVGELVFTPLARPS